jgi:hypothetical protein
VGQLPLNAHELDDMIHGLCHKLRPSGGAGIEFRIVDIGVTENVHKLTRRRAALGQKLAGRFAKPREE